MELKNVHFPESGRCIMTFAASGAELARALAARPLPAEQDNEEAAQERMTAAINDTILAGISPLYEQVMREHDLIPLTDPEFSLLTADPAGKAGFTAAAELMVLPPLTLGRDEGFVQAVEPRPLRPLTIELEVNRKHNQELLAADEAGRQTLRQRVTEELYAARCAQARPLAQQKLLYQLGAEVSGPLPKDLVAGNYFAEQRRFNLSLQARGIRFDQYLQVQGQTVEQFRQELHQQAEQQLRSRLGLLLAARRHGLWPTEQELEAALTAWDQERDGERTFAANDRWRAARRIASGRAAAWVLEHSTLTPPPEQPVLAPA